MNIKTKLNEAADPVAKIQALIQQANEAYHNADNEQGGTEWPLMDKDGSPYGLSSDIKLDGKGYVIIPFTAWQYSDYSEPVKIRVLRTVGGKIQIIPGDWYEEGWKDVSKLLKKIIKDASIGVGHFKEYDPNLENSNSKEEQMKNRSLLKAMNKKIGRNANAGMDYISENKTSNKKAIKLNESKLKTIITEVVKQVFENTLDIDDSDVLKYADFDSESKWLDGFGKMPKGYDKDITDDETIDKIIAMNNGWQNTISPSGKNAEKLASWDAFDRDREKNNKWVTRDEDFKDEINYNIYESVKRNVRQVLKETSYDLARKAHKAAIDKRKFDQAERFHKHMVDRSSQRFDPNMPVIIVGGDKQGRYVAQDIIDNFDIKGYVEPSQNPIYTDSQLIGYPKIKGYIGPMWDGGKIRYESQDAYEFYSK